MSTHTGPLLGSEYLKSIPQTPQGIPELSQSICQNISAFRSLLVQYRKVDDGINTRLNRAHALHARDPKRPYSDLAEDECGRFWTELMETWKGREEVIRYCIAVQTKSVAEKRAGVYGQGGLGSDVRLDKNRGARDELYGEEVKKQQVERELQVESIVRRRTLDAFLSRCRAYQSNYKTTKLEGAAQPSLPST